uniref:Uncharacterized protein n=1 Tax=Nelumbo nucifera TaxID=4432 RepID=A0A822Z138_NELNU|nr:TPA_asm: hypothetical protein HUJ06_008864 [Nelumbo nucifera]
MGSIKPDTYSTLRRRNSIASCLLHTKLDLPPVLSSSFPNGEKSLCCPMILSLSLYNHELILPLGT